MSQSIRSGGCQHGVRDIGARIVDLERAIQGTRSRWRTGWYRLHEATYDSAPGSTCARVWKLRRKDLTGSDCKIRGRAYCVATRIKERDRPRAGGSRAGCGSSGNIYDVDLRSLTAGKANGSEPMGLRIRTGALRGNGDRKQAPRCKEGLTEFLMEQNLPQLFFCESGERHRQAGRLPCHSRETTRLNRVS